MSKRTLAPLPEYRLEVIEGYMRPVFDGMDLVLNELMWALLPPFTAGSAALLEELRRVERGECDEWVFESPESRITCTPEKLKLEEKPGGEREHKALRIELQFKEALLLLERWLFECVWREQQAREQAARVRANT